MLSRRVPASLREGDHGHLRIRVQGKHAQRFDAGLVSGAADDADFHVFAAVTSGRVLR